MGAGFWSNLDAVGQWMVPTVETEQEAREFIASWDTWNDPNAYTYHAVQTVEVWATVDELNRAGLSQWTAPLLANMPTAGGRQ